MLGTWVRRWHWNFFPFYFSYHSLSSSFSFAWPLNHSVLSGFVVRLLLSNYILVVPGDTISQDLNFCLLGWTIWKFANDHFISSPNTCWSFPTSCQPKSLPIFRSIYPTFSVCLHLDVPQVPQSQLINLLHHMCLSGFPTSVNGTIHPVTQGTDLYVFFSLPLSFHFYQLWRVCWFLVSSQMYSLLLIHTACSLGLSYCHPFSSAYT